MRRAAALAIGVGVICPALGQARAATRAVEALARQPDEGPVIARNLYIGLAMIESQALYVLIVALILLFANPLAGRLGEDLDARLRCRRVVTYHHAGG